VFTMYFVVFTVNIIKWSGSHNTRFYTVTTVHNTNRNSRLSRVFSSGCRYYKTSSDRQMAWCIFARSRASHNVTLKMFVRYVNL
jgi:hypothetical protein